MTKLETARDRYMRRLMAAGHSGTEAARICNGFVQGWRAATLARARADRLAAVEAEKVRMAKRIAMLERIRAEERGYG